jgi:S-adenosyl methyltransferase
MPDVDTGVPHITRVYDYWLGGKDKLRRDRELGERILQAYSNPALSRSAPTAPAVRSRRAPRPGARRAPRLG